jgi:hypothetical protein
MTWFVINILAFLGTPLGLILGWLGYSRQKRIQRGVRTYVSLIALSAASLSVGLLGFCLLWGRSKGLHTTDSTIHSLITLGVWMGLLAAAISFACRLRALLPILLASVGSVLLWYGLTLR